MSAIHSVTVLALNGRRVTLKITPNTTILQILEDVCKKQELDPQEYDIKHHNTVLDVTMTIQFSRLPNNAQLELVKAKRIRKETEVLVNLQTETGSRLGGSFLPSVSLWDVIMKLNPDFESDRLPAILYMRQEICGMPDLKATTLRSLGLTSGRALLRFMTRCSEEKALQEPDASSKVQPAGKVATTSSKNTDTSDKNKVSTSQKQESKTVGREKQDSSSGAIKKRTSLKNEPHIEKVEVKKYAGTTKDVNVNAGKSDKRESNVNTPMETEITDREKPHKEHSPLPSSSGVDSKETTNQMMVSSMQSSSEDSTSYEDMSQMEAVPCERNAVVYNREMCRTLSGETLPEEFFELTLDDVKFLYRDLKVKLDEMDETPLQTSALRKLEESKRVLNNLHKYKRTVLRIQFPDQIVLQGTFSPLETVEKVHDFIREYLEDKGYSFHLYTAPPKEILSPTDRLIETNCVPCAILYFGLDENPAEQVHFLRPDILSHLSSREEASMAARSSRGLSLVVEADDAPVPSTSGTQATKESDSSRGIKKDTQSAGNPNGKVPKWFKLSPK